MKNVIGIMLIIFAISSLLIGVHYVEVEMDYLYNLSNHLTQREIENGFISYAYITMFVAILTMSAIIFAILLGMTQNMSSKLSYQTYENKILKDKTSIRIFTVFVLLSAIHLLCYLIVDFTITPITYISGLLMSFIIVTGLITYLYNTLFIGFSLYAIVAKEYGKLISSHTELMATSNHMTNTIKSVENSNFPTKVKWWFNYKKWYLDKQNSKLKKQRAIYDSLLMQTVKEYSYLASNAYSNNDIDLYKHVLKYVTDIGVHRFDAFGKNTSENEFLQMLGRTEQYDTFIEARILPFYRKFSDRNANYEFIQCNNEEFTRLILEGKKLKYINADNYNLTFYVVLELYTDMVKTQIKNEYQESIMDYRNTITRIVQTYDSQSSRLLYRKLAEDILKVAQKTLKHLPIVNYIHLTEALNEITVKNLVDFDEQMLEFTLEKQFELLSVNLTNADKITEPFSISRLNESWLSSLNQRALQARIRNLYNSKYSEKINDPDASREMYRIIETIISVLDDELKVLSIACSYDHMFLLAYADLLSTLCEIISIYVVYEIDDFKTLLRQSFRLFSNLASYLKAKDAYSFHTLFDKAKDIVANSASNSSLFEITFDGLVNLSISAYKNIDTHQYSSRCFDDVIWATTFDGKSSYLDVVVPTLDKYLNSNQLKIYLRDFKRKREHNKMRGAHLHKYESLVVGNKELLDTIEERLNVLITKKIEEETLVVTQDSIGDKKDRIESQPDTIDIDTNATFVSSQTIKPQKKIGHQILNVIKRLF